MSGEREHALLSASGAHRWLPCTPSARLEETIPETTSEYAEEGRLAHDIAELKLRKAFTEPMGPRKFNNQLKKFQENPLYHPEMLTHTDAYLDYVSGIVHGFSATPYIAVEKRLDYSTYVPEGFGTGDCIIISGCTLHVIDFKYGKGVPVGAEENSQMMLYALGALSEYSILYAIDTVKIAIVQPRLDSISEYEIAIHDLLYWATSTVVPAAEKAFKGEGEFVSGDHCRFCRAKALCRARTDFHVAIEAEHQLMLPPLISNEEVGQILVKARNLAKWISDLEEYALTECLAGNEIPGWKAVEGRSVRQFIDHDQAFNVLLENGYEKALLYENRPITLAATEKLIGKVKFKELLVELVNTPPGKPTLVVASDKREAIVRTSAEEDFKNETGGN
jgi:hypothetical protein